MDISTLPLVPLFWMMIEITMLSGHTSMNVPCDHYELMQCGGIGKSWDVCDPKTSNVRRILSAHLDVRYETRFCRKYGTPHSFGLTFSGRELWTVNGCFGSFFLCLEIEPQESNNEDNENVGHHGPERNDIQGHFFQTKEEYSLEGSTVSEEMLADVKNENDTNINSTSTDSDNIMYDNDTVTLTVMSNNTNTGTAKGNMFQFVPEDNTMMKYLIMGAIITGGVIIVLLIAVIAYLCSCHESENVEEKSPKSGKDSKYFRQKKWSIARLMSDASQTGSVTSSKTSSVPASPTLLEDNYRMVYDFIPADIVRVTSSKTNKNTNNNSSNISNKNNSNNCRVDNEIEAEITQIKSDSEARRTTKFEIVDDSDDMHEHHEYFVLVPQTKRETEIKEINTHIQVENEYDHLIHVPMHTVVDSSTYDHIGIKREKEDRKESDIRMV